MAARRSARERLGDAVIGWMDRVAEDGLLRLIGWRLQDLFGRGMVNRKLVEGERVIAEVRHSAILYVPPVLVGLLGLVLLVRWVPVVPSDLAWVAALVELGLFGYAVIRALVISRDRFVISDSRVFRVWGLLSLHEAEMEIARLLDVTVIRPWWLRPFRSGHLALENAAQQQGLREIRYIPDPQHLARAIHEQRRDMSPRTRRDGRPSPRTRARAHQRDVPISARRR